MGKIPKISKLVFMKKKKKNRGKKCKSANPHEGKKEKLRLYSPFYNYRIQYAEQ